MPLILLLIGEQPRTAEVRGVVRDAATTAPIVGARVMIVGTPLVTVTDSLGGYRLLDVAPGERRLRVAAGGFMPSDVRVLVPKEFELRIDVELNAQVSLLSVVEIKERSPIANEPRLTSSIDFPLGHQIFSKDWQQNAIAGRADLLDVLATVPGVGARGEPAVAVHARGGASDQNLVLVDGFPVYSATHFGSAGSAINPDAVRRVDFHVGVVPASFGGRLASAIDISTDEVEPTGLNFRGMAGAGQLRQMVTATRSSGARMSLAARRSYGSPLGSGTPSDPRNGFADVIGSAVFPVASDTLRGFVFVSGNQFGFEAVTDTSVLSALGNGTSVAGDSRRSRTNSFEWTSQTIGASWSHRVAPRVWVKSRMWEAATAADLGWYASGTSLAAASAYRELGVGSMAEWRHASHVARFGVSATRLRTRYAAWSDSTENVRPLVPLISLGGSPSVAATFVEFQTRVNPSLAFQAGMRSSWSAGRWTGLEPRMEVEMRPRAWLDVRATAGRSTQSVQSVRNEESVLGSALGFELPAAGRDAPIAEALQGSLGVRVHPSAGVVFEVEEYVTRQRGLILVAPSSLQPFATSSFQTGRGRVHGLAARLAFEHGRFASSVGYLLNTVTRAADSMQYRPQFASGHSAIAMLRWRASPSTRVQADLRIGDRAPSSATQSGFEWTSEKEGIRNTSELSGDPGNIGGPVNSLRLPAFSGLDIGMNHAWQFGGRDTRRMASAAIAIRNILNGGQAVGFVATGAELRVLLAARRSLIASVTWRF